MINGSSATVRDALSCLGGTPKEAHVLDTLLPVSQLYCMMKDFYRLYKLIISFYLFTHLYINIFAGHCPIKEFHTKVIICIYARFLFFFSLCISLFFKNYQRVHVLVT